MERNCFGQKGAGLLILWYLYITITIMAHRVIPRVFDKLMWFTNGPKNFLLALHSSLFGLDDAVTYH